MRDQKGFSLVELLVVIAILAIVSTVVYGFMRTSFFNYKNTSNEVELQYKSQLTMNQIENIVIDSANAVNYTYTASGSEHFALSDSSVPANADSKKLSVYNKIEHISDAGASTFTYEIYHIIFHDKKLFLKKDTIAEDGTRNYGSEVEMGDDVEDFEVSLADAGTKGAVQIKLVIANKKRSYETVKKIKVRNSFIVNKSFADIFPGV